MFIKVVVESTSPHWHFNIHNCCGQDWSKLWNEDSKVVFKISSDITNFWLEQTYFWVIQFKVQSNLY